MVENRICTSCIHLKIEQKYANRGFWVKNEVCLIGENCYAQGQCDKKGVLISPEEEGKQNPKASK